VSRANIHVPRSVVRICLLLALVCCASCSGGPGGSSSRIGVSAATGQIAVGNYDYVRAKVEGNPNATVSWAVNGIPNGNSTVGTIVSITLIAPTNSAFAWYLAPALVPSQPTVTITVSPTSNSNEQASTTITVGPNIAISPAPGFVPEYGSQQFSATVTGGVSNTAVTWQISCAEGGSACGVISQTGFYKAPNSVPTVAQNNGSVTQDVALTATSEADPSFSATIGIGIVPPNQNAQTQPIELGASGSNINDLCPANSFRLAGCGVATLGSLLERNGVQYILTNFHVAAATDGGVIGDALVQPGLGDTACDPQQTTTVANLSQLSDPETETRTKVDAAIAQVVSGAVDPTGAILSLGSTVTDGVPDPGPPAGGSGTAAYVGEPVAKSGRSTGLTCAIVQSVDASAKVVYTQGCSTNTTTVSFSDEVMVAGDGFLAEGDSGSLVVDEDTAEPVALPIGVGTDLAVGNPVSDVLTALTDSEGNVPVFVGGPEHAVAACSIPAPTANVRPALRLSLAAARSAMAIKEKYAAQLMSDSAVQGVGVGASQSAAGGPALIVYVLKNTTHAPIPSVIDGLPVRIIETTGFRASNATPRDRGCHVSQ